MASRSYLLLFPLFLTSLIESRHVMKRQANFNSCTGGDGLFPDPDDCSKFISCENGRSYSMDCGPGTEFDPNTRQCGWPSQANTNCRRTGQANVKPEIAALCTNPTADRNGNTPETFLVSHPSLCNAFFICTFNYVFNPCVICAEGMYFPDGQGNCAVTPSDPQQQFCNGRRMVGHNDSTPMRNDPLCSTLLDATQRPPYYGQTTPFYG